MEPADKSETQWSRHTLVFFMYTDECKNTDVTPIGGRVDAPLDCIDEARKRLLHLPAHTRVVYSAERNNQLLDHEGEI